ncbi:MAG: T9SS type A sorting domain-containing protein [Bacteroidota bacterium]|nr:T9SS type A sorting domain-containing protein [Bacteroidota bacterium]
MISVTRVMQGMAFSEFGRRVYSNSSLGTDHGTAAPMFLFRNGVKPGIIGTNPSLTDLTDGNLKMQFDFRSVYASVLHQWFGAGTAELDATLLRSFSGIPVIRKSYYIDEQGNRLYPSELRLYNNYPNPFNPSTTIAYDLPDDDVVMLEVFDMLGRKVAVLVNQFQPAGHYEVKFNASQRLASGAYIYQLRWGNAVARGKKMLLVR